MNRNDKHRNRKHASILILSVLFAIISGVYAQQPPPENDSSSKPNLKIIELKQADVLLKRKNSEAQILKGNVIFYHEGAFMYCDSAYRYENNNTFEAFSNVRMEQGDTIFVYGDYLFYDGNTKLAKLRNNVRMEDKRATLFTDSLDYDRIQNIGYYFDGGMLVDDENELTSYWGQYEPSSKDALFADSVKLVNKDYTLNADSLGYNTQTKIANILGPSTIVSDSGTIYTTNGWYNTVSGDSRLLDQSRIVSKDGSKILKGDTIYYNRNTGIGRIYNNMFLEDTIRKVILQGNYGYYEEKTEYALATDSARAIKYSQSDSLFIHGDTLQMTTDSLGREIFAHDNVRFYRSDLQGICDTLHYVSKDSIIFLKRNPIIWSGNNQITGNEIDIYLNDSTITKARIKDYAFSIQSRPVPNQYNQLKGRNMTAFFKQGEVRRVLVEGDAESLYYILNKDSAIIGLNKTESAFLSMDISKKKIEKLKLWTSSKAQTTPLPQLTEENKTLKGFAWFDYLRPISKYDIFRKNKRKGSETTVSQPRFVRDETLKE